MGSVPDWYPIVASTIATGIPPWDLAGIPETAGAYIWVVWLLAYKYAESESQKSQRKK